MKNLRSFLIIALLLLVVGCVQSAPQVEESTAVVAVATVEPTEVVEPTVEAEPTAEPEPTAVSAENTPIPTATQSAETTTEPEPTLLPEQQLINSFTTPINTNGDPLILFGQVLDVNGTPIPNAIIEIWQTDASGVYDHPRDPSTDGRDVSFQFFGSAETDADGWYAFRTIIPGRYEPRPRHIHFKVKQGDNTMLTSQFYFSDDIAEVEGEGMFQAIGDSGDLLLLQLVQGENGTLANGRIVIDTGSGSGELPLTPSQAEGPYYPVVPLADYDNDLANLP